MNALIFGIYGAPKSSGEGLHTLRELTISWSRYGYQGNFVEADTLDELLKNIASAKNENDHYDFCFVQKAGHVIDEQWYPPPWNREGFHEALNNYLEGEDFFVIGELDNAGKNLRDDCLLVNINQYKALGMPLFKNFVSISKEHNLLLMPFKEAINDGRFNLNSHSDSPFIKNLRKESTEILNLPGSTSAQNSFLKGLSNQTSNAQRGVFLFNIESYEDLINSSGKIDAVFSVAAGFKANRLLEVNGFDQNTEVIFYDYSKRALDIRQQIVENWDGEDFPKFIKTIFKTNPTPKTFYQLWSGVTPENINWKDVNWFWEYEMEKWGGAKAFKQHWLAYRQLPHQYVHCNLLTDQYLLFDLIGKYKRPFLWWSNAFFTVFSNWYYSFSERKQIYEQWIEALANSNPDCRVNGSDFNNTSVNGLTALEYFKQYKNHPSDELHPVKFSEIEILY